MGQLPRTDASLSLDVLRMPFLFARAISMVARQECLHAEARAFAHLQRGRSSRATRGLLPSLPRSSEEPWSVKKEI